MEFLFTDMETIESFENKVALVSTWKPLRPIYLFGWAICDYLLEIFVFIHLYKIYPELMKEKGIIIQQVDGKYVVVNSFQVTKIVDDIDSAIDVVTSFFSVPEGEGCAPSDK